MTSFKVFPNSETLLAASFRENVQNDEDSNSRPPFSWVSTWPPGLLGKKGISTFVKQISNSACLWSPSILLIFPIQQ